LLSDIDARAIASYQQHRLADGESSKSINLEIGAQRGLLRHHSFWTEALRRDVRPLKVRDNHGISLTVDQERRLTVACALAALRGRHHVRLVTSDHSNHGQAIWHNGDTTRRATVLDTSDVKLDKRGTNGRRSAAAVNIATVNH